MLSVLVSSGVPASAGAATFWALGSLDEYPDRQFASSPLGISADGSTVVGESNFEGIFIPFLWTAAEGMIPLYTPGVGPSRGRGTAWDVSADGSVVVGNSESPYYEREAFRWDAVSGMVDLGVIDDDLTSSARAISNDGQHVFGYS